jgi:RHS repeat-associated protein
MARYAYLPYGEISQANSSGANTVTRKFTGQERDEETGLDYFNARYYDPAIGRFVSADTIIPDVLNGQAFNRYAYGLGNPITHEDPDGHCSPAAGALLGVPFGLLGIAIGLTIGTIATVAALAYGAAKAVENAKVEDTPSAPTSTSVEATKEATKEATDGTKDVAKGPPANDGNAKPHGNPDHDQRIDKLIEKLKEDPKVSNIRKNQGQVDRFGNRKGRNRPDIQYDKDECHNCVEVDRNPKNSSKHEKTIRDRDPETNVEKDVLQ